MGKRGFGGAKKVDKNHLEIKHALEKIPGVTVESLASMGHGVPDLLVGYRGLNYLFEIKNPERSDWNRLSPDEEGWHAQWRGTVYVVTCIDLALEYLGIRL